MTWSDRVPIVVFGDDWGRHVSTLQHLFRRVILKHRVVWVNAIGHRVPELRVRDVWRALGKARGMLRAPRGANAVWSGNGTAPHAVVGPRVLPWHQYAPVFAFNRWSLLRSIRASLRGLGITERPLLVTGSPPSVGVVGRLGELASVYFCMDDFLHTPGTSPKMLAPLEQQLLRGVDAVVATARSLTETKVPESGQIYYLPQGVNYDHLAAPQPEPSDVRDLPHPRIGFAGGIYPRCDLALIDRLAAAFPDGSVVLVGPVGVDVSRLTRPNIHYLGSKPYDVLPAYVQAFDVGVIPYLLNDETLAVDPLKLLEYLAAGIPVVTTPLPEAQKYEDDVHIAASHDDFVAATRRAFDGDRQIARKRAQAVAREHTWERRADRLLEICQDVVERRVAGPAIVNT